MTWALRRATGEDEALLYRIHRDAMREHVEIVWGWDEADQRSRFHAAFDPARVSVIVVDGGDAGSLRVDDHGHELFLASIELVPSLQRRGLGGEIVRSILENARRRRVPV